MFYVGQKVVCVDDANALGLLCKGMIYTVSKLGTLKNGQPGLDVAEDTAPCGYEVGWMRTRFRPIVDRKTDISIFTDMLQPEQVPA